MAHGFLSYDKNIGQSWFEKKLEKELDKQTKNLKGFIRDKFTDLLFNLRTKSPRSPKPYRMSKEDSVPLAKAFEGSSVKGALSPGSDVVNTTHMGGPLTTLGKRARITGDVDDGLYNTQRTIDLGPADADGVYGGTNFFAKHAEALPPVGGGDVGSGTTEIVQELREQSKLITGLIQATDDQTNNQSQIAQATQQQADKLARDAKANAEAASFTNDDFSSGITAEALASGGRGLMRGRGLGGGMMGGGLLSMGLGGKVGARKMLTNSIMRRGGARAGRRMGIALGGRLTQGLGKKLGRKLGGKAIGKIAGKGIGKSLGKKIPLVGLGLGAIFAAQRAMQGDFLGAGLELASGAASTVPGIGTAASVALDAGLMAKDMTAMKDGGITDGPVNALIGEEGREGVFPLEGSRGKKTFFNFGKGIMEAQKNNKGLFGKLQAEGFKEYYDKQNGLSRFMDGFAGSGFFDGLKEILGAITLPMGYKPFQFNDNGDSSSSGSSEDSGQYGKKKDGFWSKRHSGEQMEVNADGVFTSKIGGVVTKIGEHDDLGKYVDIVNAEKGVTERIADIDGVVPGIEVGSSIGPGDPVAKGNDSGMIHYEIRNGGNENPEKYKAKFGHGGTKDPNKFLEGITNDVSNNIEGSTTDVDNSTVLNNLSEETSGKANSGTTIINNVVNEQSNASNNQGNDVQAASSSGDMV